MPTDAGNVVLDYLPTPILGTFWPFSVGDQARLEAVVAGQRKVMIERTALTVRDLIEANVGASVFVTETSSGREEKATAYPATIVSVPAQTGEELEAASPPGGGPRLPIKGDVVVLRTPEGFKVLDFNRIQDVTFRDQIARPRLGTEEFRNLLTLKLDWKGRSPTEAVEVGLMYLQRGLRWIPEYKITIDGRGTAAVRFQATLVNEMVDLEDATCRLVIGVPSFAFKDQLDPIALQQILVQVAQQSARDTNYLSNAIMTQAVGQSRRGDADFAEEQPEADLGPQISSEGQSEDLYVFTVDHVSLRKGQRMVLPVEEFSLPYEDLFILDIPLTPPAEVRANIGSEQQLQIALAIRPEGGAHARFTNTAKGPADHRPCSDLSK
jgi:hypothetical protein